MKMKNVLLIQYSVFYSYLKFSDMTVDLFYSCLPLVPLHSSYYLYLVVKTSIRILNLFYVNLPYAQKVGVL